MPVGGGLPWGPWGPLYLCIYLIISFLGGWLFRLSWFLAESCSWQSEDGGAQLPAATWAVPRRVAPPQAVSGRSAGHSLPRVCWDGGLHGVMRSGLWPHMPTGSVHTQGQGRPGVCTSRRDSGGPPPSSARHKGQEGADPQVTAGERWQSQDSLDCPGERPPHVPRTQAQSWRGGGLYDFYFTSGRSEQGGWRLFSFRGSWMSWHGDRGRSPSAAQPCPSAQPRPSTPRHRSG